MGTYEIALGPRGQLQMDNFSAKDLKKILVDIENNSCNLLKEHIFNVEHMFNLISVTPAGGKSMGMGKTEISAYNRG